MRELLRMHPRLLLAAFLVGLLMVPAGVFLAALGVWVLQMAGGAARDTGLVIAIAGFAVSDFWGGGITTALTRVRAPQVAVAWLVARLPVFAVIALLAGSHAPLVLVQVLLSLPAAWAGARVARKQAALRAQIRRESAASPTP